MDVLSKAQKPDRGLIPALLRLMHTLPEARKPLMRFFVKVYDEPHVCQHFRTAFQHARGVPFEDEDLMQDALAIIIKSGKTEDINSLKTYLDRNSGGTLKRASAPEEVLRTVSSAINMIRSADRQGTPATT